ncbi:MAG TPA: (E)-4-hydroxy-3-methylbut-2-enyl-diphosphate synthase [Lacipirellulaceae bacterium]|nr:(E)-4-hydroxy-3-methylbut-2-enyl-diphosphate synthase [Lacipirellulaceae bacterium]
MTNITRNPTRSVRIGTITIGAGHPIAVQSMTATATRDVDATVAQANALVDAGADVVRIAVDNTAEADAVAEIRKQTKANLVVDLQENYRLAEKLAPHVDKLRYNPGHLYHHEREKPWQDKVRYLISIAKDNDCAIRIGVNCGSVDPAQQAKYDPKDRLSPMLDSALDHCRLVDDLGFTRYCVSLKDSDPREVIEVNRRFAEARPDVPLHLGVTEAGLPPDGIIKTRIAFEQLISRGMGDTIRGSLTVPNDRKPEEIDAGRKILDDIAAGRVRSVVDYGLSTLNIISCPSCSRVENEAFVELAQEVKRMTDYARDHKITIAVMGCRVNGPGETDEADLGLWCGPNYVNLKRGGEALGQFPYDDILPKLKLELDALIAAQPN